MLREAIFIKVLLFDGSFHERHLYSPEDIFKFEREMGIRGVVRVINQETVWVYDPQHSSEAVEEE